MIDLEHLPVDVTGHISKFRKFLNTTWPCLDDLMEDHNWDDDLDLIDDWLQVNWQLLVERELLGNHGTLTQFSVTHLDPRIISPNKQPNFTIIARFNKPLFNMRQPHNPLPQDKPLRLFSFSTVK